MVMHRFVAVEMHRPGEERARLVFRDLLLHQQRVGAEVDELPPRNHALDDFRELLV
jgi:hypothetical protein